MKQQLFELRLRQVKREFDFGIRSKLRKIGTNILRKFQLVTELGEEVRLLQAALDDAEKANSELRTQYFNLSREYSDLLIRNCELLISHSKKSTEALTLEVKYCQLQWDLAHRQHMMLN